MVVSLNVTVKEKSRTLSAAALLTTLLETVRSPVFRTLVKAAVAERAGTVCAGTSAPVALVRGASVAFGGKFTLTGCDMAAGEFTAGLYDAGSNQLQTVVNAADGTFEFEAIEYTPQDAGTHVYTVRQEAGTDAGVQYDAAEYTVTVVVYIGADRLVVNVTDNFTALDFANCATGDLTVSNSVVSSAAADRVRDFSFTVMLSDTTINGVYGDMAFADGVATLILKDGQAATATGLPTGAGYTVAQTADDGFTTSSENASGTIATAEVVAAFTNARKTGDLTVSNSVVSRVAADGDLEFAFTVSLSDTTINGAYGGMTFMNGVAEFTLKAGETATAADLPTDISFTVTQADADGFTTSAENAEGAIATAGVVAVFTNARNDLALAVTAGQWGRVMVVVDGATNWVATGTADIPVGYGSSVTTKADPDAGFAAAGPAADLSFASYTENTNLVFSFVPNPAAELRWKFSSAVGRYFAQVMIPAHAGYDEALGGLAFLFADRVKNGDVYAQLWDAAARAPQGVLVTDGGVAYRGVALGEAAFAGKAENARVLWGVADASFAETRNRVPAGERQIGLYVRKRVDPVSGNEAAAEVGDFLGYLTWVTDGTRHCLPVVAAPTPSTPSSSSPNSPTSSSSTPSSPPATYKVAFKADGGTGTMAAQAVACGKAAKLPRNAFTRKGFVFLGWATKKGGAVKYKDQASVKNLAAAGKTATLYAVWAKKSYKVAFYANGGKGTMAVQKMTYGKAKKLAKNKFKREGYVFKGWAKSKTLAKKGKVAYRNGMSVKNLTASGKTVKLYSVWKKEGTQR